MLFCAFDDADLLEVAIAWASSEPELHDVECGQQTQNRCDRWYAGRLAILIDNLVKVRQVRHLQDFWLNAK